MECKQALDVRGMCCAEPIIRISKALKGIAPGEVLLVTADKSSMLKDVPAFCKQTANALIQQQESQGQYQFWIMKNE